MDKSEIINYIGKKWEEGAAGPDSYDCHHLVLEIAHKFYNKKLPSVEVNAASLLDVVKKITKDKVWEQFEKLDNPEDGCLVKLFTATNPNHIGVYIDIDGGGVIHSLRGIGVVFDSVFMLKNIYAQLEFYRFKG
jgi:hypothetical protein